MESVSCSRNVFIEALKLRIKYFQLNHTNIVHWNIFQRFAGVTSMSFIWTFVNTDVYIVENSFSPGVKITNILQAVLLWESYLGGFYLLTVCVNNFFVKRIFAKKLLVKLFVKLIAGHPSQVTAKYNTRSQRVSHQQTCKSKDDLYETGFENPAC